METQTGKRKGVLKSTLNAYDGIPSIISKVNCNYPILFQFSQKQ